jgi:hypothetical protein
VPLERRYSRRAVLTGTAGAAGLALLTACGSTPDPDDGARGSIDLVRGDGGRALVAGFAFEGDYLIAGAPQRLTFLVAGADGAPTADVPDALTFSLSADGRPLGGPVTVPRHGDGAPVPYYPLTTTFAAPGTVTATVELDGAPAQQSFLVSDAAEVTLVQPGADLPAVDTPTTTDARGVDPICTREPACALHDVTLTEARGEGRPIALLVGSPAFCPPGLCGPVLDLLVEQVASYPDVRFLHAEVYRDPVGTADPAEAGPAPVVGALGLTFEPSLFVTDRAGSVRSRLDNVYDRTELRAALDGATA